MTNDMMELNLNEMEMVNGGWNWAGSIVGGIFGGLGGVGLGGSVGVPIGAAVGGVAGAAWGIYAGGKAE